MKRSILFSVVVEANTREVTEIFSLERSVRAFLGELGRNFPDGRYEIIVAANYPPSFKVLPAKTRWITVPGIGYFGLKNAGFKAARGRYVAFWDSDCRPSAGYALKAVRRLEGKPSLSGVAGASFYMGRSYFGRLEGVFSYGHLHAHEGPMLHHSPLGHNLVLRKKAFPAPPFGSFAERLGGDMYLGRYANRLGSPLWVDPKLNMYHERQDIFSPIAKGAEKRLLELTAPIMHRSFANAWAVLPFAVRAAIMGSYRKVEKLFRHRRSMSLNFWETLAGLPFILTILVYDGFLVLALVFWPPFLFKTLRYQGGEKWDDLHRYMASVTPERFRAVSGSLFSRDRWPVRKTLDIL